MPEVRLSKIGPVVTAKISIPVPLWKRARILRPEDLEKVMLRGLEKAVREKEKNKE